MKKLLFFLLISIVLPAQSRQLIGVVKGEFNENMAGAEIYNTRTKEKFVVKNDGYFSINALATDRIRLIKNGYEILDKIITEKDFLLPIEITLILLPKEIKEVKIVYQPTGNLKNDVARIKKNMSKKDQLHGQLAGYIARPSKEIEPRLETPSAFKGHDFSAGQIPLFSTDGKTGVINYIFSRIFTKEKKKGKLVAIDELQFYTKVSQNVDLEYYFTKGLPRTDFDLFFDYVLKHSDLYEKNSINYNQNLVETTLKNHLMAFLATYPKK
jgi:hypothetical protein